MSTCERIFDLLKEKNIKQSVFARYMGLTRQLIFKWKKGESVSYYKYLNDIADYLDVSPDYLLGRSDDKNSNYKKINTKEVQFALKDPDQFDEQTYEDIQKYVGYINKKYRFKRVTKWL